MIIFCLLKAPFRSVSNAVGQCSVVYSREGPPLGGAGLGDISGVNCLHTIYEIFITALTTRHNGRHPPELHRCYQPNGRFMAPVNIAFLRHVKNLSCKQP